MEISALRSPLDTLGDPGAGGDGDLGSGEVELDAELGAGPGLGVRLPGGVLWVSIFLSYFNGKIQ